jgi:hypothetical protein
VLKREFESRFDEDCKLRLKGTGYRSRKEAAAKKRTGHSIYTTRSTEMRIGKTKRALHAKLMSKPALDFRFEPKVCSLGIQSIERLDELHGRIAMADAVKENESL